MQEDRPYQPLHVRPTKPFHEHRRIAFVLPRSSVAQYDRARDHILHPGAITRHQRPRRQDILQHMASFAGSEWSFGRFDRPASLSTSPTEEDPRHCSLAFCLPEGVLLVCVRLLVHGRMADSVRSDVRPTCKQFGNLVDPGADS